MSETSIPALPPTLPDLRGPVAAAQEWVAGLIAGVRPDQLEQRTPCDDWTVDTLVAHLFGVADRLVVLGRGEPAMSVSSMPDDVPADRVAGYRERMAAARATWADDASLGRMVDVPWGTSPGALVLGAYLSEHLTHGWDLAVATGQDPEADPRLAEPALAAMRQVLPREPRGGDQVPFGPVVEPDAGAGPTEQLANWLGRHR